MLIHLDLSYNKFTKKECQMFANNINRKNDSIIGFHMIGIYLKLRILMFRKCKHVIISKMDYYVQFLYLQTAHNPNNNNKKSSLKYFILLLFF